MPPRADPRRDAIDLALAVGRRAMSSLRLLEKELVDAQELRNTDMFWPLAVLSVPLRILRRRRIQRLMPLVQADLATLDEAVEILRSHGLELSARAAAKGQKVRSSGRLANALFPPDDPWDGPMHVVLGAKLRVEGILGELRRSRN